jgi:protein-disulfide isomerase
MRWLSGRTPRLKQEPDPRRGIALGAALLHQIRGRPDAGKKTIMILSKLADMTAGWRTLAIPVAALALLAAAPAPASAQALSDTQKSAVEQIVRDYLMKNPEIIQEAVAELERRQQVAQRTAQQSALRDHGDELFRSPRGNLVGNLSGDVTLVEFFDYNCGYCKRALGDLQTLAKADPKLRIVLKDFPVLGPESVAASKIALAAKLQLSGDKLFDYHARLLGSRGTVTGDRALSLAKEMGLDMARLQKDVDGPEVRATLAENAMLGEKLSLTGTPAYVIGDEIVSGAVGVEPLRAAIASVRQCGRATCS